jgi:3-hydroxyacyl-[acyl-carrier-protein] dehydratase
MILNKKKILEYQKNRDEFLLFDHVSEVIPGVSTNGYKELPESMWFFKLHWPGDPNMPGSLQLEALTQISAMSIFTLPDVKCNTMYLLKVNELRFFLKVVPGSVLELKTEIKSFKRGVALFSGKAFQNNKLTCSANFSMILKDFAKELITPKKNNNNNNQ